ncbi:HlyD family secretion protein [Nitratireductor sp. ZSWI3]|uniref:HlyD family secretion protein n=1 Tax=Nitratireductor sp. ZSWI3 TaxID=2966359 RepID=UPI00215055E3|nr:HlyD family secretion protein [Nitratireductor sp. ZSWI3]MCR4266399.1 HlyD family secretion protein [Nitratireductor sp. ZSWI3]
MNAKAEIDGGVEPVKLAQKAPLTKRKGFRVGLMLALPLALVAAGGYVWVTGGRYQETENAYLQQAKVTIASEASGRVIEANVNNDTLVRKGDVLFRIDPEPYRIALAQADASLAAARLSVEQLRTGYSQAVAQQRSAESEVAYLEAQLARQKDLSTKGISSKSALDEAERDLRRARENQIAAQQAAAGALAALGGNADIETDRHPSVLAALAERDKAAYTLSQTTVRAPADGIVSQASSFKTGQFVGAGSALFSLVETGETWVEANFKETQLTHMRPGQTAEIVFDTYPDAPVEATVESIGAGTGAEFSLLPAQNATGNWVKVTQRIPVRLKLEAKDADLLRTGMSATVTVDTEVARGLGFFGTAKAAQ